jgi:hypothetical protein
MLKVTADRNPMRRCKVPVLAEAEGETVIDKLCLVRSGRIGKERRNSQ